LGGNGMLYNINLNCIFIVFIIIIIIINGFRKQAECLYFRQK